MYQYVKDFQTLIAAVIAIIAAIITYKSAQDVAKKQNKSAQRVVKKQRKAAFALAAENKRREDATSNIQTLRRLLSMLLELQSDLKVVNIACDIRKNNCEALRIKADPAIEADRIDRHKIWIWDMLKVDSFALKDLLIVNISHEKLSDFGAQAQRNIHYLASAIITQENSVIEIKSRLERHERDLVFMVELESIDISLRHLRSARDHTSSYINDEVEKVTKRLLAAEEASAMNSPERTLPLAD